MKRIASMVLCGLLLWSHVLSVYGIHTSASCSVLMEQESGRILYEENPHQRRSVASITKLMTALVAVESGVNLKESISVPREVVGAEGSSLYLKEGEVITLETLLYGMLLHSGNDAALAVAVCCAGSVDDFVSEMNRKASELGMSNTHFDNPNGLDGETHYSTAYDMAVLARVCLMQETLANILQTKNITLEGRTFTNHNKLLWRYDGCVGLKTGYTQKAGRTLVSAASRNGMTLIAVTLNDGNDWEDHSALLDWGYANYNMVRVTERGTFCGTAPISGALIPFIPVVTGESFSYPIGKKDAMSLAIQWKEDCFSAPVIQGTVLGWLNVFCGEEQVGRVPLQTSRSLPSVLTERRGFMGVF